VTDGLQQNKLTAIAFYDLMFNESRPREAIERYVGDTYVQHNPHVADGKDAFVAYFERMASEYPGKRVEFKRGFAEGEYVASTATSGGPATSSTRASTSSGFDEGGKVVVHWDFRRRPRTTTRCSDAAVCF
jgi:predicted SnoaL-like aldol condensation-catalyzing enzyme